MAENVVYHANMGDPEQWDDTMLIQQYDEAMAKVKKQLSERIKPNGQEASTSEGNLDKSSLNSGGRKRKKKVKRKSPNMLWSIGDYCRCVFTQDGAEYEAQISKVTPHHATVVFIGYGDTQTVKLNKLKRSNGEEARKDQELQAEEFCEVALEDEEEDLELDEHPANSDSETNSKDGPWVSGSCRYHQREDHSAAPHHYDDSKDNSQLPPPPPPPFSFRIPPTHFGLGHHQPHLSDMLPPPPPPPGLPIDNELLHTMLMSWYMTGYHTGYYKGATAAGVGGHCPEPFCPPQPGPSRTPRGKHRHHHN